jgi:hypothetical protein
VKREHEYISRWPSVNLRIPETIRKELEAEAQHRMLSVSAIVRESLAARYAKHPAMKADR